MAIMRATLFRSARVAAPRSLRPMTPVRTYANKENMSATQGQASPGTASNVGNPGSVSAEQQEIKNSRATDSTSSPDTASVQTPVSNPSGAATGQQSDDTDTQQAFKQDPNKPADQKRAEVDKQGQKPLDAANK